MTPSTPPRGRLWLVSNRLPVTIEETDDGINVQLSSGGLATGLVGLHKESGGGWIGWPGLATEDGTLDEKICAALKERDLIGVGLSVEEHRKYYQNLSNQCIWPLFHYFHERMHYSEEDWECYVKINRRFADTVLAQVNEGDTVFVQDFHLMLLPQMLRDASPDLRIGFFLHIPFPSSELVRIFPKREELLRGVLGADLIAFHTVGYARHFRSAACNALGLETRTAEVHVGGRKVQLLAQPLAIDAETWGVGSEEDEAAIAKSMEYLKHMAAGRKIVLGVERMDYTKGIPERLKAFRELLAEDPTRVERVMMIQVAVPSRAEVRDYVELKDEVDRIAGSINAEFGRPGLQPLHYMYQSVSPQRLRALYRAADIALVTPLRDGLNLVAKEFIASRHQDDGVLVLGESTGASWELGEALRVNPFDSADIVRQLERALVMPMEEQQRRMKPMRARIEGTSVEQWARTCLDAIRESHSTDVRPTELRDREFAQLQTTLAAQGDGHCHVFLDYDGTLREFTGQPLAATPTPEILDLLKRLVAHPKISPWVVSGRPSELLENWVGATGVGLVAEHGAFVRAAGDSSFRPLFDFLTLDWRDEVREIFEHFTASVPGARIEEKEIGIAWHYRLADPILGAWQAKELFQHLIEVLQDQGVQVMRGNKVLEVRPAGINKGNALRRILRDCDSERGLVIAAGDDHTDESMFQALEKPAWGILVGNRPSAARYRVDSPAAMREFLAHLLASSSASESSDKQM